MIRDYTYKGHKYWITVESAINTETSATNLIAYVSNSKPTAYSYGTVVKNSDGTPMEFQNEIVALTNANAIKQSEIDSKA